MLDRASEVWAPACALTRRRMVRGVGGGEG